jgi:glycosyltransferase involved in cell wall biosynthesis
MNKLLIVGSNSIHVYNYIELIKDYFDEILLISDKKREGSTIKTIELDFHLTISSRFKTVKEIKKAIADFKPSLIHIHQANSCAYYTLKAARSSRIPKVLTVWGSDILVAPKKSFWLKKMVQYNLRNADAFTSDAKFLAAEMQRIVPEIKLDILIANFGIETIDLNWPKENIIYSNRLHKKLYRVEKVIDAFNLFITNSKDKNWRLVIAATGEETDNLKTMVDRLGLNDYVEFVGWVNKEKNAEYYAKAKIFVSIPESDATAISLLEAMAYGCIPVLSDLPANREWIKDGENGVIINSLTENIFERALTLNLDEASMINKKIIEDKGTKKVNKEKFIQLYDQLLDKIK